MGCTQSNTVSEPAVAHIIGDANVAGVPDINDAVNRARKHLINDYSVDDNGIVIYHIETEGLLVKKRFNDFKVFYQEVNAQSALPALPPAGLLTRFKRRDAALIEERQARLEEILHDAPQDQVAQFLTVAPKEVSHEEPKDATVSA